MSPLPEALAAWRAALGADAVLDDAGPRFTEATTSIARRVPAVLRVRGADDVARALEIARRHRVPVYPVSTGRNWGYGCATPARDGCAILDLSAMDRIVELDAELGLVTVEPGVTQGQLRAELDRRGLDFMVPTTGAGPGCSLVGNALERGYGLTPEADHFGALTRLEAVLPDGTRYRSALTELGGATVDGAYKWGVGPYLDGLFGQSNLGVVTQATIALRRRPERVEGFFLKVDDDARLEETIAALREVMRALGGVLGSINVLGRERVLAMTAPLPPVARGAAVPSEIVAALARRHGVGAWTCAGGLYGPRRLVAAARAELRDRLGHLGALRFFDRRRARLLRRLAAALPFGWGARLGATARAVESTLEILEGIPSDVALRLAYWRSPVPPPADRPLDPGRDGCGLIWYAPLVPLAPAPVRTYVEMVRRVCAAHAIDPLVTLTVQSERCLDSSVPLLFDRADPAHAARALACHAALLDAGRAEGFLPYRLPHHAMGALAGASSSQALAARIKDALDPDHVLAPGRYAVEPEAAVERRHARSAR